MRDRFSKRPAAHIIHNRFRPFMGGLFSKSSYFFVIGCVRPAILSSIHASTSDRTNATRRSPSSTAAGKRPATRRRLTMVRERLVSVQTSFMGIRMRSTTSSSRFHPEATISACGFPFGHRLLSELPLSTQIMDMENCVDILGRMTCHSPNLSY